MKKIKLYFFLLLITSFTISCSVIQNANIFTDKDDVQLGQEVVAQINSDPKEYPIYKGDPELKKYINERIFQHILTSPAVKKKNVFNYTIEIIDRPDVMNAFALPGGYIYVYTGLLKYLDSEAALAGVIAHEIAHAEKRHATKRMTQYYGASILVSLVLGKNPSQLSEIVSNLFVGAAFLANSRANEDEADESSVEYLKGTRYYPGAVKFFFEKMKADNLITGKSSKVEVFLSTHPDPLDRISTINTLLEVQNIPVVDYTSNGSNVYRDEYKKNILARLK